MNLRWLVPVAALACACSQSPTVDPDPGIEGAVPKKKGVRVDADLIPGDLTDGGTGFDPTPEPPPRPFYGPTQTLADAPPPASGGTLALSADGRIAVAADPDRDAIFVVDTELRKVSSTIVLNPHDEPGRVIIDGLNRAHVALRRGGALVTIDLGTMSMIRRSACPAPRGLAWDASSDRVHVACATGELVTFDASSQTPVRTVKIERDLRDVLVTNGTMFVTKLKSAELLALDGNGKIVSRVAPPGDVYGAWRTVVDPTGAIWMLHQRVQAKSLHVNEGGYGSRCEPAVAVVVTPMPTNGVQPTKPALSVGDATLAVDVAVGPAFRTMLPILGNSHTASQLPGWHYYDARFPPSVNCGGGGPPPKGDLPQNNIRQLTAAAIAGTYVVMQSREPASLIIRNDKGAILGEVELSSVSREDTGHAIFHSNAGGSIACASCHLEGGEDGRTWTLDLGTSSPTDGTQSLAGALLVRRRTPSLRGTIAGTAPYHWLGDQPDIGHLLDDVYSKRMNGGPLDDGQKKALEAWVGAIPAPPAKTPSDRGALARGGSVFSGKGGCITCHANAKLTDNDNHFVGMPFPLQTPSLVGIGWRAPYLHDGCAKTLADRFDPACRAEGHGNSSALSQEDISDLVTYLESL
jgi:mono/diheme cytochrome c family protein